MPSPPRQSRSSPRRALHERSDSQTNERGSPKRRSLAESEGSIYEDNPYPTKPSQILRPSGQHLPYDPLVEGTEPEEGDHQSKQVSARSRQGSDKVAWPQRSSADLSFYTASRRESTAYATLTLERSESPVNFSRPGATIRKVVDEEESVSLPIEETSSGITSAPAPSTRQPANKESDNSLSSTNTTGTVVIRKPREGKKRASYSAFPYTGRPSSSRSNVSTPTSQRSSPKIPEGQGSPKPSASPSTPDSANFSSSERQVSSGSVANTAVRDGSPTRLQYPVIRPPTASGSWAESSNTPPQVPPRAAERAQRRWNPHLSTVPSEGRSSTSAERTSQAMWLSDSSPASKSSSNVFSLRSSIGRPPIVNRSTSDQEVNANSETSPPGPSTARQRDFSGSTIRVVEEEDLRLKIPSTIPGSRDSASPKPAMPEERVAGASQRPGSRASFFRDSIPAWAKSYYARPMSSSSSIGQRDSTATDNISLNISRPKTRTQGMDRRPDRRMSGLNMHPTRPDEVGTIRMHRPEGMSPRWSPHLWHDRMSLGRRRSLFKAPSIDERAEGHSLTKRNAQILLFAVGFVFPLAWFFAAFLPLPPKPAFMSEKGKTAVRNTQVSQDLEKRLGPADWARYENARWWRKINRIMCATGVIVIVIFIVMAAVTAT